MERKLTLRQATVLAALERLGRATMIDLSSELALMPSAIARVLDALERRGLVARSGNPSMIYMGGVEFWPVTRSASSPGTDVIALMDELGAPDGLTTWLDPERRALHLLMPLDAVLGELTGADERFRAVRQRVLEITEARALDIAVGTAVVADGPTPCLELRVAPRVDTERLSTW